MDTMIHPLAVIQPITDISFDNIFVNTEQALNQKGNIIESIRFYTSLVVAMAAVLPIIYINRYNTISEASLRRKRWSEFEEDRDPVLKEAWEILSSNYEQNIAQGRVIFAIAITSMSVGFGLIAGGGVYSLLSGNNEWIGGAISIFAGLISQFISYNFMKLYDKIKIERRDYVNRIEELLLKKAAVQYINFKSLEAGDITSRELAAIEIIYGKSLPKTVQTSSSSRRPKKDEKIGLINIKSDDR